MSGEGPAPRAQLSARVVVATCALLACVGMCAEVLLLPPDARPTPWLALVLGGVGTGASVALLLDRQRLLAGWIALGAGGVLFEWIAAYTGRLLSELLLAATALGGWVVGASVARVAAERGRTGPVQDGLGREVALGALAAAWMLAGVSKLLDGGLSWVGPGTVWHVLYAHLDLDASPGGPLGPLARSPALASATAAAVLGCELAAPLLVVQGRVRRAMAVGLAALHCGLSLVGFAQWPVAAGVLLLAWPVAAAPVTWRSPRRLRVLALAVALVSALVWLLPVDRWLAVPKGRRSDGWHIAGDEGGATAAGHHDDEAGAPATGPHHHSAGPE